MHSACVANANPQKSSNEGSNACCDLDRPCSDFSGAVLQDLRQAIGVILDAELSQQLGYISCLT